MSPGTSDVAATAATFPLALELIMPKAFVAIEDLYREHFADFEREYKWVGKHVLGQGAFGTVLAAKHRETGALVTIKSFRDPKPRTCTDQCLEELAFYVHLGRHPNVAELLDVVANEKGIGIILRHAGLSLHSLLHSRAR